MTERLHIVCVVIAFLSIFYGLCDKYLDFFCAVQTIQDVWTSVLVSEVLVMIMMVMIKCKVLDKHIPERDE